MSEAYKSYDSWRKLKRIIDSANSSGGVFRTEREKNKIEERSRVSEKRKFREEVQMDCKETSQCLKLKR